MSVTWIILGNPITGTPAACTILRLPAPFYGYLHHSMATCTILRLPAPFYGYLHHSRQSYEGMVCGCDMDHIRQPNHRHTGYHSTQSCTASFIKTRVPVCCLGHAVAILVQSSFLYSPYNTITILIFSGIQT